MQFNGVNSKEHQHSLVVSGYYNIASKFVKFNYASVLHIPIVHAHDVSKQIPQENKFSIGLKML